jgi:hypothetical protein
MGCYALSAGKYSCFHLEDLAVQANLVGHEVGGSINVYRLCLICGYTAFILSKQLMYCWLSGLHYLFVIQTEHYVLEIGSLSIFITPTQLCVCLL